MPLRSRLDSPRPLDLSTRESPPCQLLGLELVCVRSTTALLLEPELRQQVIERGALWYSFSKSWTQISKGAIIVLPRFPPAKIGERASRSHRLLFDDFLTASLDEVSAVETVWNFPRTHKTVISTGRMPWQLSRCRIRHANLDAPDPLVK
jgi:hypothetical protein